MKNTIRAISALLCVLMLVSWFPTAAFAEEGAEEIVTPAEEAAPLEVPAAEDAFTPITEETELSEGDTEDDALFSLSELEPEEQFDPVDGVDSEDYEGLPLALGDAAEFSAVTAEAEEIGSTEATLSGVFSIPYVAGKTYAYGITVYLGTREIDSSYSYATEELEAFQDYFDFSGLIPNVTYAYRAGVVDPNTWQTLTQGEIRYFTTAGLSGYETISAGESKTIAASDADILLQFTAPAAGDYVFSAEGEGSAYLYNLLGEEIGYFDFEEDATLTAAGGESFWISCCSEGSFTITVTSFTTSVTELRAETGAADVTGYTARISGTFTIPYQSGTTYAYGIVLYLNGTEYDSSLKYTAAEVNARTESFAFSGLVPGVTYEYMAVIREGDASSNAAEGALCQLTADGAAGTAQLTAGQETALTANAFYSFTAAEAGNYMIMASGQGEAFLYSEDGSMLSSLSAGTAYWEAAEGETLWIYCSRSSAGSPFSVIIMNYEPEIDSFYAITNEDAVVTDTSATLSGEFNIPYRAGSSYAYGMILYLNGRQTDARYSYTNSEIVAQVSSFTFTDLLPNICYTYMAVIRDSRTWEIIADGNEEQFTSGSGSSVESIPLGVSVDLDAVEGKTLRKFISQGAGNYRIRLDGEGSVFAYGEDGERKAYVSSDSEVIVALADTETLWLYCSGAGSAAAQLTITRFNATVTEFQAVTAADPLTTDTSAVLSATFQIPYRANSTYTYGILLYVNGEQIDSALQTTSSEVAGLPVSFEFTGLVPEAAYSYKAVVMEQSTEESAAQGEEKTFRTGSPGASVKTLLEDEAVSPLETFVAELYRFSPSDAADYKISTTGSGSARILAADGTLLGEISGEGRIRVSAAGRDSLWLYCTNYSAEVPFTLEISKLTVPAGSFAAVTEEIAVTEKSAVLRIGFSIPFAADTQYDYGVTLYLNDRYLDSLQHSTDDELAAAERFEFKGLLPNISYRYRVTIVEHDTLETVFTGEEASFTTADGLSVSALTPGVAVEVTASKESVLYSFTSPEEAYYRITVAGGSVTVYNVQGDRLETYNDGDEDMFSLAAGEVWWLYCQSTEEGTPLRFTIAKFEAAVFDFSALTGDATNITGTSAVISGTFSIPFDPDGTYDYGIEVFAENEEVAQDYRNTGIEMNGKTESFVFTGLVPNVTYSYQAVIYESEAGGLIKAGEKKQFHTGGPGNEIPILPLWEPYPIAASEQEILLRFLAPEYAEYTFLLSGGGSAKLFSETGNRIAYIDNDEDASASLAAGEAVWIYCYPSGREQTLTVMGWTADEARVVGDVPDGLWAVIYDPDGGSIASFARMDAGEERRLTIQSTDSAVLNNTTNTSIDIPYFSYTGKAVKPVIHLYNGDEQLDSKSYSISYKNNTKASSAEPLSYSEGKLWAGTSAAPQIIVKMKGNYSGTKTLYFNIDPIDISECVTEDIGLIWSGKQQKVAPTLVSDGKAFKIGTDYSVSIALATDPNGNPITSGMTTDGKGKFVQLSEAGTYILSLTGKGNYYGETECVVTITKDVANISKATVSKVAAQNYTGKEITPPISVTYNKRLLSEGTEYTLEYSGNILPGTASVRIVGVEEHGFTGSKSLTFKINPAGKLGAVTDLASMTYTGKALEQTGFKVYSSTDKAKTKPLTEGTDFTVSYEKNLNAGTAKIILEGINGYKGSKLTKTFKITPAALTAAAISEIPDTAYSKAGVIPEVTVSFNGRILQPGIDYTVKIANNNAVKNKTEAKAPTVTVTGKGNFTGTVSKSFSIVPKELSAVNITAADVIWSGKPNKYASAVSITDGGKKLSAGTDYEKTLVFSLADGTVLDKTSPALAEWTMVTVTISAAGNNYTGSAQATYRIIPKTVDIAKASFRVADKEYLGTGVAVTLKAEDITQATINKTVALQFGKDYIIESYTNNFSKGTAKVTFRGTGSYGGSKTVSFKIVARDASAWWQKFLG